MFYPAIIFPALIVVALALMERIKAGLQVLDIIALYAADKERSCFIKYLLFLEQDDEIFSRLRTSLFDEANNNNTYITLYFFPDSGGMDKAETEWN